MLNRSTRILQPAPTPKHRNTGLFEFSCSEILFMMTGKYVVVECDPELSQ